VKIGLVGCVKSKLGSNTAAQDLYVSPLFRGRRAYVEQSCDRWFIISAKYGLVAPDQMIAPYDMTLKTVSRAERRSWSREVIKALQTSLGSLENHAFEIHAGAEYRNYGLIDGLKRMGATVEIPAGDLKLGQQLAFYASANGHGGKGLTGTPAKQRDAKAADSAISKPTRLPGTPIIPLLEINQQTETGPFAWLWPNGDYEQFQRGWVGAVQAANDLIHVRHAIGRGTLNGKTAIHTVTWVAGKVVAEGFAAPDYEATRSVVSMLRVPRTDNVISQAQDIPDGMTRFSIVRWRDQFQSALGPDVLAVRIRDDDFASWARYALLQVLGPASLASSAAAASAIQSAALPAEPVQFRPIVADQSAIVQAILAYGTSHSLEPRVKPKFSGIPEANQLLIDDPFAFLLAVICDQGVPAERAWVVPYRLKQALGFLDPPRVSAAIDAVSAAIKGPPALHRYVEKMPVWLVAAANRVVEQYGGDAAAIWSGDRPAAELQKRFDLFLGIGQKKAAMAVGILQRDFGLPIKDMSGNDIAYDVHVRRVFLRTSLAESDDVHSIVAAARRLYPFQPGALDFPAWLIGRNWCHPGTPDCQHCPLFELCPKEVERASTVAGA
jgi:uncharacterized HhH-GPD family protein